MLHGQGSSSIISIWFSPPVSDAKLKYFANNHNEKWRQHAFNKDVNSLFHHIYYGKSWRVWKSQAQARHLWHKKKKPKTVLQFFFLLMKRYWRWNIKSESFFLFSYSFEMYYGVPVTASITLLYFFLCKRLYLLNAELVTGSFLKTWITQTHFLQILFFSLYKTYYTIYFYILLTYMC